MTQVDKQVDLYVPKIFVVCDQKDTAPVWGYILRHQGLIVILETSIQKAIEHWTVENPDLVVVDGQALLDSLNFTGSGDYLGPKVKGAKLTQRSQALALAATLDAYNNRNLCP